MTLTLGDQWQSIEPILNCSEALKAKGIRDHILKLPDGVAQKHLIFHYLNYSTTKAQEEQTEQGETGRTRAVMRGLSNSIVSTTSSIIGLGVAGLKFMLPANLFWTKILCVMATSKSYVL